MALWKESKTKWKQTNISLGVGPPLNRRSGVYTPWTAMTARTKKLINKISRSHPIKTHLDPVGKLLAVLANKGSLHCVLQVPEQRFCPCNGHFLLFLLADVLSDHYYYYYHHLDYSYSQISLPIVIPSAALFLLRLGLVRTRTPPLDTLSHWKWDLSKGHDWLFLKSTSVCIASTLFERNKSVLARSLPEQSELLWHTLFCIE